jgi:hypothetical protein
MHFSTHVVQCRRRKCPLSIRYRKLNVLQLAACYPSSVCERLPYRRLALGFRCIWCSLVNTFHGASNEAIIET